MSSIAWIVVLVLLLAILGTSVLVFVTVKYYWGERGAPPVSGEERLRQRQAELAAKAEQIEYSKKHPIKPRRPSFWDNSKVQ
jgi:sensor histidine kinase regulating citrate/malate metabolism